MAVDLLETQATLEAELRGLREARALALSQGKGFGASQHNRIVELESMLQGLRDAERLEVQKQREKRAREIEAARKELIAELNLDFPQWQDALRSAEIAFREAVGSLLRCGEISDRMQANLGALLDAENRKNIPLSKPDREMRWSGRLAAVLAGLAFPSNQYGNLSWHDVGVFRQADDWVAKETKLLKPVIREYLDASSN